MMAMRRLPFRDRQHAEIFPFAEHLVEGDKTITPPAAGLPSAPAEPAGRQRLRFPLLGQNRHRRRRSNIHTSASSVEAAAKMMAQIHERWRKVGMVLRSDSGLAREPVTPWCEANGVDYVPARNVRVEAMILAAPAAP
jgi:hypothetical protein